MYCFLFKVILSCTEMKYFWISWFGGLLEVGQGSEIGKGSLLSWQDPGTPKNIHSLSLATGFGATGKWEFQKGLSKLNKWT